MNIKEVTKFYFPTTYLSFHVDIDYDKPTLKRGSIFEPNRKAKIIKTDKDHFLLLEYFKEEDLPEEIKEITKQEYDSIKKKVTLLKQMKWRIF